MTSATAWYLTRTYAAQHGAGFKTAVTALEEMDLDEAKVQIGEA